MRDCLPELTYAPRDMLLIDKFQRVLCVAPHPDDEVFGCAGLLALLAGRGCQVQVLILTGGEAALGTASQAHAQQRLQESTLAATVLGYPAPQCLGFADRGLSYSQSLRQALQAACEQFRPELLLLPSLSEPHPDHQVAALAGLAVAQAMGDAVSVLCYEVGAPLHANVYVDISSVADKKWQAVAQFGSQLGIERYAEHARAFAELRAFGLAPSCRAAEAYFRVDLVAFRTHGALAALPQWPWVRAGLHLANTPEQLPLVSVLIRSMDRPCLAQALASVALQSYANLNVWLVNASGHRHSALDYVGKSLRLTLLETTSGEPCGRSRAANLALAQADGDLALFLDDDDLLHAQHIEKLVHALLGKPQAAGAYSGVRVEGEQGALIRDYDLPWSKWRLQGINFLPIHAVLFRLNLVRRDGLRFDEQLPVLEDWDFWRQLTASAELIHCPGVSAVYRQNFGESGLANPQHDNHWRLWHGRLLAQYAARQPSVELSRALAWHAIELDRVQCEQASSWRQLQILQESLTQVQAQCQQTALLAQQHLGARDDLQRQLELFSVQSQTALAAKEAQLQQQALEMNRVLAAKEEKLQAGALQAQAALAAKEAQLQQQALEMNRVLAAKDAQLQQLLGSWVWRWVARLRRLDISAKR